MLVTLVPIVTLVRLEQPANASSPILVTGSTPMVLGMLAAPAGPAYAVMVMVPLLTVNVYQDSEVGQPSYVVPQPVVPAM
jgi:hypothetical protein